MRRAFIIDDHFDTAEVLEAALSQNGYHTEQFQYLSCALIAVKQSNPCLILVDWNIPDTISTEDFIRLVRREHPEIKIIVISGDHRVHQKVRWLDITKFLLKPVDIETVLELAQEHCKITEGLTESTGPRSISARSPSVTPLPDSDDPQVRRA